jgi:hypothetical protein
MRIIIRKSRRGFRLYQDGLVARDGDGNIAEFATRVDAALRAIFGTPKEAEAEWEEVMDDAITLANAAERR